MGNSHTRERAGGVGGAGSSSGIACGWVGVSASVGEADGGDASEAGGVGVRLVLLTGTDDAGYASCDAPLMQRASFNRAGQMGRRLRTYGKV